MSAVVNLTALSEARAKMTPGEYSAPHRHASIFVEVRGSGRQLAAMCGHGIGDDEEGDVYARMMANAAGFVAIHNAADVLIELARAAKSLENAQAQWREQGDATVHVLDAARIALRKALAKVSL